jgi:Bacterial Ig domain
MLCHTPAVSSRGVVRFRARTLTAITAGVALAALSFATGPGPQAFAQDDALDPSHPSVSITSPPSGTMVRWGERPTLNAEATPGEGGSPIVGVRFAQGDLVLSTDTTAPYQQPLWADSWTGPAQFSAVAIDGDGNESAPATVELVSNPGPHAYILHAAVQVIPIDRTVINDPWTISIDSAVNGGRPADDPLVWIDHVELLVDGAVAQTISAEEGCAPGCAAPGRPTSMAGTFTYNPVARGRGRHTIGIRTVDSSGFGGFDHSAFSVVNRPTLTLRDTKGAVQPATVRLPSGTALTIDAAVASDEPDSTIRSVQLWVDGRLMDVDDPCPSPTFCPRPVVIRKVWSVAGPGAVHDVRVAAADQWLIETAADILVDVYPGTLMTVDNLCCEVALGKAVTLSGQLVSADDYLGEPGRRVTVQWRPAGATSWLTVATPTTSSTGRFSGVHHTPHRNGTYRFSYAGIPDTIGGVVETLPAIVYPRVKGKLRHNGWIRPGHIARLDVHTSPADPTTVLSLQRLNRHDHWVTIRKRHVPASRHTTFAWRLHRKGWHTYQVVRSATAGYRATESKVFEEFVTDRP